MARKRKLETEARWRELVRRHVASGLSVRQFCEMEGISENSLYSWRQKLTKREKQTAPPTGKTAIPPPDFVPVQLGGRSTALELVHPLGYQIRIEGRVDVEMLGQVLDALERRGA